MHHTTEKNQGKHRSIHLVSRPRFEMRPSGTQSKSEGLSTTQFCDRMPSHYYTSSENCSDRAHLRTLTAMHKCSGAQNVTCMHARNPVPEVKTARCISTYCHRDNIYYSKIPLFCWYRSLKIFYLGWKVFTKASLSRGRCRAEERKGCLGVTPVRKCTYLV